MYSMTGYGRSSVEQDGRQLTIELKSVNHRFLDIAFRMPRSFGFMEDAMRRQIGAALSRGHVDVFATYRNMREDSKLVAVDEALLKAYMTAFDRVEAATGLRDDRSLSVAARLPDVMVVSEAEEDQDALRALVETALSEALGQMRAMRAQEGEALRVDIAARVDRLEAMTRDIEARYPETVKEYKQKLEARVQELLSGAAVDEQRLLQEVALMADRSAIAEETVRLHSHFQQIRGFLTQAEPAGRKLDFIVQELNREVNTISSKSQDVPITNLVVEAKAEIEKIREQVQNVE
ncbi:MAG: YicC family protein [Clostridia bacterium]|nr:YicC family protein [Clostridia bacterium]